MVNMTPDFFNFFRNALEILGLKSWGLLTLCVFTVDIASVGRFLIDENSHQRRTLDSLEAEKPNVTMTTQIWNTLSFALHMRALPLPSCVLFLNEGIKNHHRQSYQKNDFFNKVDSDNCVIVLFSNFISANNCISHLLLIEGTC